MIPRGAVGIKGNTIACVGDSDTIKKSYRADRVIDARGRVVMPGFINGHTHSASALSKGVLVELDRYLEEGMAGYNSSFTLENLLPATRLHLLQGIKSGITTYCDASILLSKMSRVHEEMGIRARLSNNIRELDWLIEDKPRQGYTFDRSHAEANLKDTHTLLARYGTSPEERISAMVNFQGLDLVSREMVLELKELARKHSAMLHIHLCYSANETVQIEQYYGKRPAAVAADFGILNANTVAAHMHHATHEESVQLAKSGVNLVMCPTSLARQEISSPAAEFAYYGGSMGLGTDEATFHGVDMFDQLKLAIALTLHEPRRIANGLPKIVAWQVLRMATIEGAKSIGMDKQVGSLEPGKRADVILVDFSGQETAPVLFDPLTNIVQNLVYAASPALVETVIIDGKIVLENRNMTFVDEQTILDDGQRYAQQAAEGAYEYYKALPDSEVLDAQRHYKK